MPTFADDEFDPYHKWLSIPKDKRPPTHYQLLGISPSEEDSQAIEAAAKRQSDLVRQFKQSEHADAVGMILYEIEEARLCLLNPESRRQYDSKLNQLHKRQRSSFAGRVPAGHTVGEESGLVRQYFGIMAVIVAGFMLMAAFAFWLPWRKLDKADEQPPQQVAEAQPAPVEKKLPEETIPAEKPAAAAKLEAELPEAPKPATAVAAAEAVPKSPPKETI